MYHTYNMGIGFILALAPADAAAAIVHLKNAGFPAYEIGTVGTGADDVVFE